MKIKLMSPSPFFAFLMVVLILNAPFVSLAQQKSVQAKAEADAERDAETRVNKPLWFFGGCLGGILVIIIANVHEPSPPAASLLGKSPEYVSFYTDAYKAKTRNIQTSQAMRGCLANVVVIGGCYGCLLVGGIIGELD